MRKRTIVIGSAAIAAVAALVAVGILAPPSIIAATQPTPAQTASGAPSSAGGTASTSPSADATATPAATQAVASKSFNVGPLYVVGTAVTDDAAKILASVSDRTLTRIAGSTRYETATAVSKTAFPKGADTLLVASGDDFPDGLAAAPAAIQLKAPILLTPAAAMDAATIAEATRLKPKKIIIVGSLSAVSGAVASQLQGAVPTATVARAAGDDRYATAVEVSKLLTATADTAFIAAGTDFPDALTAGPAAGTRNAPLLLTAKDTLPASTAAELGRRKPKTVYLIGDVVTADVKAQIKKASGAELVVYAGVDMYETAQVVAQHLFPAPAASIAYASGLNFYDAMVAAPLAIDKPGPILLDAEDVIPAAPTVDAGRYVSWYLPSTGRIIRYILSTHPDDEFSSWSILPDDPRYYNVWVSLTTGQDSDYCKTAVSNPYRSLEYLPKPQPAGGIFTERCKKHRMDSWNTFILNVKDGADFNASYTKTVGVPIRFDGRDYPNPRRDADPFNNMEDAADFRYKITDTAAYFSFDLGELNPRSNEEPSEKIIWAFAQVRGMKSQFPVQAEGDIIGGGYYNNSGTGSEYTKDDHQAMWNTMQKVDFGLPGSQYAPMGHYMDLRSFGAWVPDYCSYMCHPYAKTYKGPMGRFQFAYGWDRKGIWQAGDYDVEAGFSAYQSFGKWN